MKRKLFALTVAAMMTLGCASGVMAEEAGFEEFPIGEEQDVDVLHVAAVYFQPVEMEPAESAGLSKEDSNLHIEADVSALENELGFGVGDWVPYMTVKYEIIDQESEETVLEGDFMPMAASDGPHYGANINLPDAGTYTLKCSFYSPAENGYLLHVDQETGVSGNFWEEPIVVEFTDWEYVPQEW
ncbi:MAG: iron transporter [Eubacteriales bacterium]|nr:iron transporter [Eubacteriales bacterium]